MIEIITLLLDQCHSEVVLQYLRLLLVSGPLFQGSSHVLDSKALFLSLVSVLDWTYSGFLIKTSRGSANTTMTDDKRKEPQPFTTTMSERSVFLVGGLEGEKSS